MGRFKGEFLRELFEKTQSRTGKTQAQVAKEIGVTAVALNNYFHGRAPTQEVLTLLKKYFNVSRDAFFDDADGGDTVALQPALVDTPRQPRRGRKPKSSSENTDVATLFDVIRKIVQEELALARKIRVQLRERFVIMVTNSVAPYYA